MRPQAAHHLLRRGRIFAFRCRLPQPLATSLGRSALVVSLRTADEPLARALAQALFLRLPVLRRFLDEATARLDREQTLRLLRAWMVQGPGLTPAPLPPAEMSRFLAEDIARWTEVVRAAGVSC